MCRKWASIPVWFSFIVFANFAASAGESVEIDSAKKLDLAVIHLSQGLEAAEKQKKSNAKKNFSAALKDLEALKSSMGDSAELSDLLVQINTIKKTDTENLLLLTPRVHEAIESIRNSPLYLQTHADGWVYLGFLKKISTTSPDLRFLNLSHSEKIIELEVRVKKNSLALNTTLLHWQNPQGEMFLETPEAGASIQTIAPGTSQTILFGKSPVPIGFVKKIEIASQTSTENSQKKADFEVWAKRAPESVTYTFGAKFEPPEGRIIHGEGQWMVPSGNPAYLSALHFPAVFPLFQLMFLDLKDSPERPWNIENIKNSLKEIKESGRGVTMDLAPRPVQPMPADLVQLPDPLYGVDDEIANGTGQIYLERVAQIATAIKELNLPAFVRIGGEFNGWWNGYHPYLFPIAFRKIVDVFRDIDVPSAAFVWCYEASAPGDFDEGATSTFPKWFPGNDYIDWFGIDLYGADALSGSVSTPEGKLTAYGRTQKFLKMALDYGRPVTIAESGPSGVGITADPADAENIWAQWFGPYFQLMADFPQIKAFHYVNFDWTQAAYYAQSGWKNGDLSINSELAKKYRKTLKQPRFLHHPEFFLLNQNF